MKFTRRQLANYAADQLISGHRTALAAVAEHLYTTGRANQIDLLTRDIQAALEARGVIMADITSAHVLDTSTREDLRAMLEKRYHSSDISLAEHVDSTLLGGVVVRTADEEYDGSIRRNINRLKAL
jgi:ATP synthase F1 delta subunit